MHIRGQDSLRQNSSKVDPTFPDSTSASTSMPTSASLLKLRINLRNNFACMAHVALAFECGFPMMPRLDASDADMRSLLLSEFKDLESALQKTGRRVRMLLEECLRSFLRRVECCVLCRIAASVA